MKRLLLLLLLLAVVPVAARAEAPEYRTVTNIAYRDAAGDSYADSMCRADVYYPVGVKNAPVVLWYHGGGLTLGHREIPKELKNKGFVVVGLGYRFLPHVSVETCIDDAAAGAAWAVRHVAEYGGDPSKVFVTGHSAGGYLTMMIGLDKRCMARYGLDPDEAFSALIPYSGQAITHFERRRQIGLTDKTPLIDELSPMYYVRADAPPVLILSGDRELELLGRYEENAYFWRMLCVAGHPDAQLREFDGFDHGNMPQAGHFVAVRYIRERCEKMDR